VTSRRVDVARRPRGFTLLELLVVIAIMAALTAAFPLALNRFVPARRVDGAARQLLADIRRAEARSVTTGRPVDIVPETHGYRISETTSGPRTLSTRTWRSTTALELTAADDSNVIAALRIFPDRSSTGAHFRIRDGERVRSLIVSELTSRVRMESEP
jgi:type II secretion system protein H